MDFRTIGKETTKGAALHALADNYGLRPARLLTVSGAAVDLETVVVNGQVFELRAVATDTTLNTASGQWNQVLAANFNVTMTAHGLTVGTILRVESEFFKVEAVVDANTLTVSRAYAGSTIAAHADGVDIFKQATAGTYGRTPIPLSAIATPATVATELARAFNHFKDVPVDAAAVGAVVVFHAEYLPITSETMTNGAFTTQAAPLKGEAHHASMVRAVVAGDVTATVLLFPFRFAPTAVSVRVVSAAQVEKAWDGAVTIIGNLVVLGNGGTTDWAATDLVTVHASA